MEQTREAVEITTEITDAFAEILTPAALDFVARLEKAFGARRRELLARRQARQARISKGEMPDFLAETAEVRQSEWQVAAAPADLDRRWVEITGPVDRKMVINALNSGANCYMADFEDSNSPTWTNNIEGQINLRDAIAGTITFTNPNGKRYQLNEEIATLMVRPRGWHLEEKHMLVDGQPVSASLFDFGLYMLHNAKTLLDKGSGPYFYLPKLESHLEARLWNDTFVQAQDELGIPQGSIRATVLIENILAAFEMEEILYELRAHAAGLNAGRWDYIFSAIRTFRDYSEFMLPDRGQVTMTVPFMHAYTELMVKTCHKRGAHAIGGMAAFIPSRRDAKINEIAFTKVREDKEREAKAGCDGTWVAHPDLVPVAREAFIAQMGDQPNQKQVLREEVSVTAADLYTVKVPGGSITEAGLRTNISVAIQYMAAWLTGNGCVPIYNLMEDAATAEISRAQVWQWINHQASMDDGRKVTAELFKALLPEILAQIKSEVGDAYFNSTPFDRAAELFTELATGETFTNFLTLTAYNHID